MPFKIIVQNVKKTLPQFRRRLQRQNWLPGAIIGFCLGTHFYWLAFVLFLVLCWLAYPYFVRVKKLGTDKEVATQFVWGTGGMLWGAGILLRALISQPSEDITLISDVLTFASYLCICYGFLSIVISSILSVLSLRKNLLLLRDRYGIDVQYPIKSFPVFRHLVKLEGTQPNQWQFAVAVSTIVSDINRLPEMLVKRCEICSLILCCGFREDGLNMGGMCFAREHTLCLNVSSAVSNPGWLSHSFYHEFFHMLYTQDDIWQERSDVWLGLNPRDFDYGPSARSHIREGTGSQPYDAHPGFLTRYSTADIKEDSAELFSYLMTSYGKVKHKARHDRFFAAKVLYMQERLAAFCPEMDDRFWHRIAKNG